MTPEEKAERYNEALEMAKIVHKDEDRHLKATLERIFPELKESDDEKIRKGIISGMVAIKEQGKETFAAIRINDCIAWLEKQGEQKFAEGTFVNVDDVREDFVKEVYRVLDADSANDRANQIIDAFDNLPTVTIKQDPCEHCKMAYSTCYSFPCDEKKAFEQGKSVLEVIKEEPQVYKTKDGEIITYSETDGYKVEQKPQGKTALEAINEEKVDNKNCIKSVNETSIAINNPDAYKIGFADGEAHAKEEQWKPSDEQIKHLTDVVYDAKHKNRISTNGYEPYSYLYALLMQLKRLKG